MASYDKKKLVEGKYTVKHLMNTAADVVKTKTQGSIILDKDAEDRIPKFEEAGKHASIFLDFARCDEMSLIPHSLLMVPSAPCCA